jgi:hypothetical protein
LYYLPNIIRTIQSRIVICAGYVTCAGEMSDAYKIVVGKPGGEIGWEGVD